MKLKQTNQFDLFSKAGPGKVPKVSFEFFPPKTEKAEKTLWESIRRLEPLGPEFVSVTYGAGGSTRHRTHNTVTRIRQETLLEPAAHLTCVNATQSEVNDVARQYWQAGIRHIVALRGDPPDGTVRYVPHRDGYAYASDLVSGLTKIAEFEISVAAYPEGHPDARSSEDDLDNLKRKIDAGARRAITQYSFDTDQILKFIDRLRGDGVDVPVVPGILPVVNFAQVQKFSVACGCLVPRWMMGLFEGLDEDPETRKLVAAAIAIEQCRRLQEAGCEEFHFYTLNRADLAYAICHMLGLRPRETNTDETHHG